MKPTEMTKEQLYEMVGMCVFMSCKCERDAKLNSLFMDAACVFLAELDKRKL